MNHIITRQTGEYLELLYQGEDFVDFIPVHGVRRIHLGMTFPEDRYGYVCAVAERSWEVEDYPPSRGYILLDEASGTDLHELTDAAICLKDRYLAQNLHCPNDPVELLERLRWTEGLTHYPELPDPLLRARWKSYVSKEARPVVSEKKIPSPEVISRDLDRLFSEDVVYPDTGTPVFNPKTKNTTKKLIILNDMEANFETQQAAAGVATGDGPVRLGIWLAVMGLEGTHYVKPERFPKNRSVNRAGY